MIPKKLRENYPMFTYEKFKFLVKKKEVEISYLFKIGPDFEFSPKVVVRNQSNWEIKRLDREVMSNLVFQLGLIEMFSYWKATCSPKIAIKAGYLNNEQIEWWRDLLMRGMGQFFYENKMNFKEKNFVKFVVDYDGPVKRKRVNITGNRILVPVGGGKDSTVSLEILSKDFSGVGAFILKSINVRSNIVPSLEIASRAGINDMVLVERILDPKLVELNKKGFLNGHTPFSAYLAFLSILCAYIFGYKHVAFSNERSSDEGNIGYLGEKVNHQYSKSFEFEEKFKKYNSQFLSNVNYFSFLRPLYELQIAKIFSCYSKYFNVIKSCNVGMKQDSWKWCSRCPKCLSTFILLYPFLGPKKILHVFPHNLYEDESLYPTLENLISEEKIKPFECVGTRRELKIGLFLSLKYHKNGVPKLLQIARENFLSAFAENLERKLVDECEKFSASADFAPTKRAEKIPLASASGASSKEENLDARAKTLLASWGESNLGPSFEKALKKKVHE